MATDTLTPSPQNRRGAFRLLFFALMAVGAGNTMLISSVLPLLVRRLELPAWTAGAIFSLSAFLWVMTSPFWGKKSNKWGRRPVAALGMAGFTLSMVLFGTVGMFSMGGFITFWPLIFFLLLSGRSLFGIFGSGTNPAAQAYVADRTTAKTRTEEIATLTSGFTFGTAIGPSLAGVLIDQVHLLAPVFVIAVIAALIGLLIWFRLPEQRAPQVESIDSNEGKGLWRSPTVLPFLVYGIGLSLVSGVILQTFPYFMLDRLHEVGYLPDPSPDNENPGAQELGLVMTLGALATLTAQLALIPRLKLSPKTLMVSGAALLVLSAILSISLPTLAVFGVAQIMYGVGQGFSRPGFTSGASLAVGTTLQGNVAGLVTATNAMGFVVSPIFGLWAYEHIHPSFPFAFSAIVLCFMGVFAFFKATPVYAENEEVAQGMDDDPND